jgi:hypothetical protein
MRLVARSFLRNRKRWVVAVEEDLLGGAIVYARRAGRSVNGFLGGKMIFGEQTISQIIVAADGVAQKKPRIRAF